MQGQDRQFEVGQPGAAQLLAKRLGAFGVAPKEPVPSGPGQEGIHTGGLGDPLKSVQEVKPQGIVNGLAG